MASHYQHALIVDDEETVHALLKPQLGQLGIRQCSEAASAEAALALVSQQTEIDLLICDLRIPGMDGLQLLRALSETSFDGDLLLMSGADQRVLSTVLQLGKSLGFRMLGALQKPLKPNDLKWALRERKAAPSSAPVNSQRPLGSSELHSGLRQEALRAFYQPKFSADDERIIGFEALARWQKPDGTLISPAYFIPQAEKLGIIDELTLRFLSTVFQDAKQMLHVSPMLTMAINFSVDTLQNRALPEILEKLTSTYDIAPNRLIIEVTESRLSNQRINLLEVLARLHLQGFQLSIDDFGTGYSSLYRVKDIPFGELKIDKSFVSDALRNSSARAVIRSSVKLAQDLKMQVIAEGVETDEVRVLMQEMGCNAMQGFYYAKPQALMDNMSLLSNAAPIEQISSA